MDAQAIVIGLVALLALTWIALVVTVLAWLLTLDE